MEPRSPALVSRFFTPEPPVVPYQGSPRSLKVSSPITSVLLPALAAWLYRSSHNSVYRPWCFKYQALAYAVPSSHPCFIHSFLDLEVLSGRYRALQEHIGRASLVAQMVKNLPANVGDPGLIPGLGRSPEKGLATHSSILA